MQKDKTTIEIVNEKPFSKKDIVSLLIFVSSLSMTVYLVYLLFLEALGIGQAVLSFMLILSLVFTLFFGIGLLRHFTGFVKKSKNFYVFQFLISILLPLLIVPMFSSSVINHSQKEVLLRVKNELIPVITYIEKYKEQYGKLPQSVGEAPIKPATLQNIYYDHASHTFILGTYIASLDIDGAQIFYNSRDKQWYQFHNDMYQHYKDKKERPKSIEHYISFHNQADVIASIIRKINGVWTDPKQETIQNSENHLKSHKKSCEEGHAASCTAVGMRYGMGLEVEQSDSLALKYFVRACELNDANGCHYLADIYARGKDVQKDITKATELYEKACRLGDQKACNYIQQ